MTESADPAAVDDRLRLFSFATAEKRVDYLRVLRAFEHARTGYVVLLHAGEVADILARAGDGDSLNGLEVGPLLEQLHTWGVLERSYDGTRAATLAEYRNRHYVYQFGQVGYQAYRAVEDVLAARPEDASLSRLVLPELLTDLSDLADANSAADADLVYRKLNRLDTALNDMATRAAHFYLSLGDVVRTTDVTPESFLAHKDALLAHMREFSLDLARFAPKLAAAIERVEATGLDALLDRAASSDERVFLTLGERRADWTERWAGLVHWFWHDPKKTASGLPLDPKRTASGLPDPKRTASGLPDPKRTASGLPDPKRTHRSRPSARGHHERYRRRPVAAAPRDRDA
ncbi:MAG: DUF2397 domain-containing protein [Rhodococcus sp. (in: high G+C Gram-positive bacteria)]